MIKKKLLPGIASILAFVFAIGGCAKANNEPSQEAKLEPIVESKNDEEAPEQKVVFGEAKDLSIRKAPSSGSLNCTLQYCGDADTRANEYTSQELTQILNLNTNIFSVTYQKNGAGTEMLLSSTSNKMYANKQSTKGNKITVTVIDSDYVIDTIKINFDDGYSSTAEVYSSDTLVSSENGYYVIDSQSFTLFNNNSNVETGTQVRFKSIVIYYDDAPKSTLSRTDTNTLLSYEYIKEKHGEIDILNKTNTYDLSLESGSTYKNWNSAAFLSGVSYEGNSSKNYSSIQLRNSNNSGIVTTDAPDKCFAHSISISWNTNTTNGRVLKVYGSNSPYSGPSDLFDNNKVGTLIASFTYDSSNPIKEFAEEIDSIPYKYLGIKASDALYLDSISIQWGTLTYSNIAIRFGALVKEPLWNRFDNIQGYGVMVTLDENIDDALKNHYDAEKVNAACAGEIVKNYYTELSLEKPNPALATDEQKGETSRNYYIWNLYQKVSEASLKKGITSVAYIKLADDVVFLEETTTSVKDLAQALIDGPDYDEESFDGSLSNLVTMLTD